MLRNALAVPTARPCFGNTATDFQRSSRVTKCLKIALVGGIAAGLFWGIGSANRALAAPAFRPPAVPLVTFDPYMSIWSENNHGNQRTCP